MTTTHETPETTIRHRIDAFIDSLRAKDIEALRGFYAADVVSFDVEAPLQHLGVDAKLANWTRAFGVFRDLDYELRDLAITVDDTVAFGHGFGRLSGTLANGTATPGMWVRVTFGFRRFPDGWRVVHDQASVPLDITTGTPVTDLTP